MYPKAKAGGPSQWTDMSGTLDGTNFIGALDVFNDGTNKSIWAASPAGCWKSPVGTAIGTYTLLSNLPSNLVTDIAIDEDDYNHVYLCFGGYDAVNVYETKDGGTNWTDVSAGLPAVPTGAIVINEDNTTAHEVYVGTDAGIYVKLGDAPWQLYSTGMPFVSITDLEMYYGATIDLYAATYGRGIWKSDCYDPPALDAAISEIVEPETEYCDPGTFIPTFVLANIGTTILTNADVEYTIDGGVPITQAWSGSLAQGASTNINFPAISLVLGIHDVVVTVSNPNGTTPDNDPDNDSMASTYALWNHDMPYSQDFDAFPSGGNTNNYDGGTIALSECWVNETGDDIDWSVNSGPAPSAGTGPSADHTTGTGSYLYTESSGPNGLKNLQVSSPVIDLTNYTGNQVTFWYHMYGANMGSLQVDLHYGGADYTAVSVDWNGTTATSISGDQGDAWYQATVDISAADGENDFVFTFNATTGADYLSELAIDDFEVTGTSSLITITWDGSSSSNWKLADNWTPVQIPTSSDNVVIADVTTQPIIDATGSLAECNNMTIDNGASITIDVDGQMTVYGSITNNAGNTGLLINSDASGSGSLIQNTTGGVNATVQLYFDAVTAQYHMISSPINNAPLTLFPTTNNLNYYDETTDDYWTGATNDAGSISGWTAPIGNLNNTEGYLYYYYQTTLNFEGQLNDNTTTSSISIDYNDHGEIAPNTINYNNFDGWNFIANPYTSAIDWSNIGIVKTNVDATIYYYDGANSQYASWTSPGVSINGGTQYIPSGQGFFVKADPTSGTLSIPSGALIHNSQSLMKFDTETPLNLIKLRIEGEGMADETIIRFLNNATNEHDSNFDAYKIFSFEENMLQLYSITNNLTKLSINTFPELNSQIIVPLKLIHTPESYNFIITEFNFENIDVYIKDNVKNETLKIGLDNVYNFVSDKTDDENRFELIFEKSSSTIKNYTINDLIIYPNPNNGSFYLTVNNNAKEYFVEIHNTIGQIIYKNEFINSGTKEIKLDNRSAGIYFIKVIFNNNFIINKKIIIQ